MQTDIPISEIFGPTIQGEGRRAGYVSIFVRVARCNMSCRGFGVEYSVDGQAKVGCDSYYSVDRGFASEWRSLSSTDIIDQTDGLSELDRPDIVITGGEPLLYWSNPEFQTLLKHFINSGHFVTIETNGSICVDIELEYQKQVAFSIGIKLKNSQEKQSKRVNIEALRNLLDNSNKSYLKFVTSGIDAEMDEIVGIQKELEIEVRFPSQSIFKISKSAKKPLWS